MKWEKKWQKTSLVSYIIDLLFICHLILLSLLVQVEALEETIDGMEASLASIPEEIDESALYSEQGQPLLPMPNDQEFYEDEVEGDFDGNKVVTYQMMKLDH